ncbi:tetratricopeptide repeat protein [Mucilaginibacter sp.]|uniref:tetratricopeptide repeat protein n=1 Tax=Mucilaginibacter sp. TaxID=1882438 RepID=UPI003D09817D
MTGRKIVLPVLILLFSSSSVFCQTEALKNVVNGLAFYKQKKDLKYLANAKKSVDSLVTTRADSADVEKSVYRAIVYSSILYIDSLNKLNQPAKLFTQTTDLVDKLSASRKIYRYQPEMDYAKHCLANVYIRKAFVYMKSSDFINALQLFEAAQRYAPAFKPLNEYIAYSHNKLGNSQLAAKYYANLVANDSTKAEYVQAASNTYKLLGDTASALSIIKKGRKLLPNDKMLLLDEANIYSNRKDYRSLTPLLPALLDINSNNADIAFVAAVCYDNLDQYDKAESLYLHSIELNSSAYDPIFNLGLLYFKESEVKKERGNSPNKTRAAQWLEKANEISPNDANCLHLLQLLYAQAGNQDQYNKVNNKLKQLTNQ